MAKAAAAKINAADYADETWTYIGPCLEKTALWHAYLDSDNTERIYQKRITGSTIGGRYTLPVKQDGPKRSVLLGRSTFAGLVADGDRIAEWQARSAAVQLAYKVIAEERRGKRSRMEAMSLERLNRAYRALDTMAEQRALLALVISIVTK